MQDASQDDFPLNAADHALAQMLPVGQGVAQAANAEVLATSVSQQGGNNDGEEEGDEEVEGVGDGEEEGDEEVFGLYHRHCESSDRFRGHHWTGRCELHDSI